jgi:hypothetical protein
MRAHRGSSSRRSGDSTRRRRIEQDIANERMEQWIRENKEYNLQLQEYYMQWEEQRDVAFVQQLEALQLSMSHEQLAFRALNTLYY